MNNLFPPLEVFYSYADADELLRRDLDKHLSLLSREGLITTWHKRQIMAGTDWAEACDRHLNTASIILLLISANFLESDYCYGKEMQQAMQRHELHEARVIPILLRPVDWHSAPFGRLKVLPSNGLPISQWRNRDEAFVDITKGIRAALAESQDLTLSTPLAPFPRIWNIPYARNWVFTGRERVLTQLAESLQTGRPTALSQPQAISGLGGIGKTQIAVEYAYQYRQAYQAVFWTRADTREALLSGFIAMARLLNLAEKNEADPMIAVRAVIQWLTAHTAWLLIFDNADDFTLVYEFLPSVFGGHILLTTRTQIMSRLAQRLEVEMMNEETGALLLFRRAGFIASTALLEEASPSLVTVAKEIVGELGGLPLALDQAGAYIEETQCSFAEYLHLYRRHRATLLQRRGGVIPDHPEPVATTWSLSFEKIEQANAAAAELLRLCAFLHPDEIPEAMIIDGASVLNARLQTMARDPFAFNTAIGELRKYSLVKRNAELQHLTIHRLVQGVVQDIMDEATQKMWAAQVVSLMASAFPEPRALDREGEEWIKCQRYSQQILRATELVSQWKLQSEEAISILNFTGTYLGERAQLNDVEPFYQQALTLREQMLPPDHPDIAQSLNYLAGLYLDLGRFQEAEPLFRQALAMRIKVFGERHVAVAESLNDLAGLNWRLGKLEESSDLLQRSLAIREDLLDPYHPDVALSLGNLAVIYGLQGKYEQAEPLHLRALAIRERVLGPNHPYLALNIQNIGFLYTQQEKYERAEPYFLRALAIRERVLEPNHPDIAESLHNLASLYQRQGKDKIAQSLFERSLALREALFGSLHLETAKTMGNLAKLYAHQGNYAEAETFFRKTLAAREHHLGAEHPEVAKVLGDYAPLLRQMNRTAEADALDTRIQFILAPEKKY